MRFENIKNDFPKMPQEIRNRIEQEVERQLQTEQPKFKGKRSVRRAAVLSLAAVMLCGLTAFAAGIYRMQQEKIGEHGVSVSVTGEGGNSSSSAKEPLTIPNVKMETGYLPEGMVQTEQGKYSFEDTLHKGGVSIVFYRMDTGDDEFEIQHGDVVSSEEFSAGDYQGIYLEYPNLYPDEITFHQQVYVAYTDVHYIMEIFAASDVSKEDVIKIAQNVRLIPTDDTDSEELVDAWDWSSYLDSLKQAPEGEVIETITSIASEEMKNLHAVGDSFPTDNPALTAKISEVKVSDGIELLNDSQTDEDLKKETDKDGRLLPATIQYMKTGGLNSLSQEIRSRQVPQKLVYVTAEYTNTGKEEMKDVLFCGNLTRIQETNGQMQIAAEEPKAGDEWDMAVNHGLSGFHEMLYYDVHGGERGNNYIPAIRPGETVTVHMAWVVTEEELDSLYISLDPSGSPYEFTDSSLEIGYVDIRQ